MVAELLLGDILIIIIINKSYYLFIMLLFYKSNKPFEVVFTVIVRPEHHDALF